MEEQMQEDEASQTVQPAEQPTVQATDASAEVTNQPEQAEKKSLLDSLLSKLGLK